MTPKNPHMLEDLKGLYDDHGREMLAALKAMHDMEKGIQAARQTIRDAYHNRKALHAVLQSLGYDKFTDIYECPGEPWTGGRVYKEVVEVVNSTYDPN